MPKEERRLKVLKFKKDLFEFLADATENVIDRLGKVRIRLHGMQSEAANQYYTYNYKASRGL